MANLESKRLKVEFEDGWLLFEEPTRRDIVLIQTAMEGADAALGQLLADRLVEADNLFFEGELLTGETLIELPNSIFKAICSLYVNQWTKNKGGGADPEKNADTKE